MDVKSLGNERYMQKKLGDFIVKLAATHNEYANEYLNHYDLYKDQKSRELATDATKIGERLKILELQWELIKIAADQCSLEDFL